MLPKIIVGWQKGVENFLEHESLAGMNVLTYDGSSGNISEFREWLSFVVNLAKTDPEYVLLIYNLEKLSVESQNILLKPLEEKPSQVVFYLLTEREAGVLPTILSRCLVTKIKKSATDNGFWKDFVKMIKSGPGEIITYCEKMETEKVDTFVNEIIMKVKQELGKEVNNKRIKIIEAFLDGNNLIKMSANINKRLVLEYLMFTAWKIVKT